MPKRKVPALHKNAVNARCRGIVATPQRASLDQALFRTLGVRRIAERVASILLGRVLCPEDQAGLVAFLVSPDGDFITGQSIVQDGGILMFGLYHEPRFVLGKVLIIPRRSARFPRSHARGERAAALLLAQRCIRR